ncbi:MAG: aldo/keto reductase [Planctomycetota bacterium]|nr:aldo/keto reductase [Planctomycetota bacterium]
MKFHALGQSGLRVPALGLGSWITLADPSSPPPERVVRAALDAGIWLFDTADVYDMGAAEEMLGKALVGVPRHQVVIATKAFWPMSDNPNDRGLSRKHLFESVHNSLRRMGTDYVDLFQCHRFDPEVPLEETVLAFGDLIRQGKLLYWGTSQWSARNLKDACALCDALGVPRPISEQARFNLLCREVEPKVVPTGRKLGIGFLWWSPLAQGVLTGKYALSAPPPAGTRAASERRVGSFLEQALAEPEVHARVARFVVVAREAGHSPAALALSWCLDRVPGSTVLIGITKLEQLPQNLAAVDIEWTEQLRARVEAAFAGPALKL